MTSPQARTPAPGSAVLDVVEAMDRLRTQCPWDAEQTHTSLAPYAVEEAHELAEAIDSDDRDHLVEELGDVLLQVVFHARVGQDDPEPFDIDDVARGLLAKLHRRHPHVFGDEGGSLADADAVARRWEQIKAQEKPGRSGVLDGIPVSLPALQTATKLAERLERRSSTPDAATLAAADPDVLALWQATDRLRARGLDAEQALGSLTRTLARAEDARGTTPRDDADRALPARHDEPGAR